MSKPKPGKLVAVLQKRSEPRPFGHLSNKFLKVFILLQLYKIVIEIIIPDVGVCSLSLKTKPFFLEMEQLKFVARNSF